MYSISKATSLQKILAYVAFGVLYVGYKGYLLVNSQKGKKLYMNEEVRMPSMYKTVLEESDDKQSYGRAYRQFVSKHENAYLEKNIA